MPRPRVAGFVLAAMAVSALLVSCGANCETVNRTIPPVERVLADADAVVRANVSGFPISESHLLEAELDVVEVLLQPAGGGAPDLAPGTLRVDAYHHECWSQTGLRSGESEMIVVLTWLGPDNALLESPWLAKRTLLEGDDGTVRFLDEGDRLNQRIDLILPDPTIDGLLTAVRQDQG